MKRFNSERAISLNISSYVELEVEQSSRQPVEPDGPEAVACHPGRWLMMRLFATALLSTSLVCAFDTPLIGDDPRAPVEVDDQLMCESCLAIVDHVMTSLKKKARQ